MAAPLVAYARPILISWMGSGQIYLDAAPEAGRSMPAVLLDQLDALGPGHRNTLATRERLAWIQERQGRSEDAGHRWRATGNGCSAPIIRTPAAHGSGWRTFRHEVSRWW